MIWTCHKIDNCKIRTMLQYSLYYRLSSKNYNLWCHSNVYCWRTPCLFCTQEATLNKKFLIGYFRIIQVSLTICRGYISDKGLFLYAFITLTLSKGRVTKVITSTNQHSALNAWWNDMWKLSSNCSSKLAQFLI